MLNGGGEPFAISSSIRYEQLEDSIRMNPKSVFFDIISDLTAQLIGGIGGIFIQNQFLLHKNP